ncbi:DMT family transporter [Neisseria sp. S1]|uniref:DMT family transporter n=1 Tax=Neisseria sp. S1 TaxID=3318354 RepID=UPI003A87B587
MNVWILLVLAIALEICGTLLLKLSNGFANWQAAAGALFCYGLAFYCLSVLLKTIPLGIAYAIWSGVGIAAVSIIGWLFMNQKLDMAALIGIGMIIAGVLVINLFSQAGTH